MTLVHRDGPNIIFMQYSHYVKKNLLNSDDRSTNEAYLSGLFSNN